MLSFKVVPLLLLLVCRNCTLNQVVQGATGRNSLNDLPTSGAGSHPTGSSFLGKPSQDALTAEQMTAVQGYSLKQRQKSEMKCELPLCKPEKLPKQKQGFTTNFSILGFFHGEEENDPKMFSQEQKEEKTGTPLTFTNILQQT
jgi:hypothetical protein